MNDGGCERCANALLDLSEHQRVTAESARQITASCPWCGDELRRLVAGFALAYELPAEESGTHADASVLSLADARVLRIPFAASHTGHRILRLRVGRPSWAPLTMAAAALVMVAIGTSLLTLPLRIEQRTVARPSRPSPVIEKPGRPEKRIQPELVQASESPVHTPKPKTRKQAVDPVRLDESPGRAMPRLRRPHNKAVPTFSDHTSATASNACRMRVEVFEKLLEQQESFLPSPSEEFEVGICYGRLGKIDAARKLLSRASKHSETKGRALSALRQLDTLE